MARKRKGKDAASTPSDAGSASSAADLGPARPWTDEEMAAAKPLPLPTGDIVPPGLSSGVPHAGKGETKPAGRPEDEDETAR